MGRSVKKGPYVQAKLAARVNAMNAAGDCSQDLEPQLNNIP